jgi:O-antigen biosynthesis protein WbqP
MLLFLSPLMVFVAVIIYLEDGSPVIYKQFRPGLNDRLFKFYKFRTMKLSTPDVATHLLNDPAKFLLRSGRILRKTSIDELPNIYNVLLGDMNIVGPRPTLHNQYDLIMLRKKHGINSIKPGITGWAQINGRDEIDVQEKIELEKWYMINKSLIMDLKIVIKTISKIISSKNVSH